MAERGAPLGNTNATKNRPWRLAIDRILEKKSRVEQVHALDEIAEKVIDTARRGPSYEKDDPWFKAVSELADRLDGRPTQTVQGPGDDGAHTLVTRIEEVVIDPKP